MNVRRKYFERATITGPMGEFYEALEYCYQHGFEVIKSGSKRLVWPRVDTSQFEIEAEREIEKLKEEQ